MHEYRKVMTKINNQDVLMETTDIDFKNRIIYIFSEIHDKEAKEVISSIHCLARLSKDDIYIYVNSPGGSVTAGMSIYDTCILCGCDIVTIATGQAASMGSFLIAAAGTKGKRFAHPSAEFMIHQPLGGAAGQASEIRIQAEHILKTRDKLNAILSECTGQNIQTIECDTERDNYMSSREALKYGLIDKIGDPLLEME